jgi:hypothetical protein
MIKSKFDDHMNILPNKTNKQTTKMNNTANNTTANDLAEVINGFSKKLMEMKKNNNQNAKRIEEMEEDLRKIVCQMAKLFDTKQSSKNYKIVPVANADDLSNAPRRTTTPTVSQKVPAPPAPAKISPKVQICKAPPKSSSSGGPKISPNALKAGAAGLKKPKLQPKKPTPQPTTIANDPQSMAQQAVAKKSTLRKVNNNAKNTTRVVQAEGNSFQDRLAFFKSFGQK